MAIKAESITIRRLTHATSAPLGALVREYITLTTMTDTDYIEHLPISPGNSTDRILLSSLKDPSHRVFALLSARMNWVDILIATVIHIGILWLAKSEWLDTLIPTLTRNRFLYTLVYGLVFVLLFSGVQLII